MKEQYSERSMDEGTDTPAEKFNSMLKTIDYYQHQF